MPPTVPNSTRRRFLTGTATLGAGVATSPLLAASGIREAMRLLDEPDVPLVEITS